jgi:hypothetical protein
MPSIFLSYAHEDMAMAEKIEVALKVSPDVDVWRDKSGLRGGAKWEPEIIERIGASDFFVPLLSRSFVRFGRIALKELKLADQLKTSRRKPATFIVPARIEPVNVALKALATSLIFTLITKLACLDCYLR